MFNVLLFKQVTLLGNCWNTREPKSREAPVKLLIFRFIMCFALLFVFPMVSQAHRVQGLEIRVC